MGRAVTAPFQAFQALRGTCPPSRTRTREPHGIALRGSEAGWRERERERERERDTHTHTHTFTALSAHGVFIA